MRGKRGCALSYEEDKAMAEWVKNFGIAEQASNESLTKLRKCLYLMLR